MRGFFGFVGRVVGVSGGFDFENVERVAAQHHVAVARSINQLGVVIRDVANQLTRVNFRLQAVILGFADFAQNCFACLPRIALLVGMDFQEAEGAFHDLQAGRHVRRFQRHVCQAIDFDAGRDFHDAARLIRDRIIAF